jgi:hypothetical protein
LHIEDERRRIEEEGEEIDSQDGMSRRCSKVDYCVISYYLRSHVLEEDFLLANLDAGLSTLQHVVYIIGTICYASDHVCYCFYDFAFIVNCCFTVIASILFFISLVVLDYLSIIQSID